MGLPGGLFKQDRTVYSLRRTQQTAKLGFDQSNGEVVFRLVSVCLPDFNKSSQAINSDFECQHESTWIAPDLSGIDKSTACPETA